MPDERESPSAGWREVCREMDAATDAEEATRRCPDCGRTCKHVLRDVYECADHGLFRPADETEGRSLEDDVRNRLPGTAD